MSRHDLGVIIVTVISIKLWEEWKIWWKARKDKQARPFSWTCTECKSEQGNFYRVSANDVIALDHLINRHKRVHLEE